MTEFVSEPTLNPALSPSYCHEVARWLDAPKGLMHCWSPNADLLEEAVRWWMVQAEKRPSETRPLFFAEGDFFPLLQKLNELLAAAQRGESEAQAHAGQFWLVRHAEQLSAEHIDILRRICQHYPELGIHLALFSQTQEVPAAAEGVRLMGLLADAQLPQAQATAVGEEQPLARKTGSRIWLWAGALSAVVLAGFGLAFPQQGAAPDAGAAESSAPASAASQAASEAPASPAASAASSAAVPAASAPAKTAAGASVSLSRRWLLALPPECSVVVHKQSASLQEAEVFKASSSLLANARILLTVAQDGKPARYLVVTGPFRSADRVHNYMQRLDWKASASSASREELLRQIPN
mgnify:CR=1 FL=1